MLIWDWVCQKNRLICLSGNNLPPESCERIISSFAAWSHAGQDYQFDDRWHHQRYIVNIEPQSSYPLAGTLSRHGERSKEQLKAMIECGDVVCLNDVCVLSAGLFYIDDNGKLICGNENAFRFGGAKTLSVRLILQWVSAITDALTEYLRQPH